MAETLSDLAIGEVGTIDDVEGQGSRSAMAMRLLEMGFVPGTRVKLLKTAPFGDPLQFQLRGFHISLRRAEARSIRLHDQTPTGDRSSVDVRLDETTGRRPEGSRRGETIRVALAGNPNVGKTSLFNVLTGSRFEVGNYPGVTVERRAGKLSANLGSTLVELIDLPGTYSLTAAAEDEAVAFRVLCGEAEQPPDAVVLVLDASNLARNLYFAVQIRELGLPFVIALNMVDVAKEAGLSVDPKVLSDALGVPVIETVGRTGEGTRALAKAIAGLRQASGTQAMVVPRAADDALIDALERLGDDVESRWALTSLAAPKTELEAADDLAQLDPELKDRAARQLIALRYAHVDALLERLGVGQRVRDEAPTMSWSMRVDEFLTHPVAGLASFVAVMAVVFVSLFSWADPFIGLIESAIGGLGGLVEMALGPGLFTDMLTQGVIAGVGNVLVFVPQIALLFLFIGLLEDSGYLARAAFMLDRLMSRLGLHGRAFIPLLSGYACAIPAIMGTRTIGSFRDRMVTILMIPYMSCSARLPIYTLIIGSLFVFQTPLISPGIDRGLVLLAMYLLSTVSALAVGLLYKRTILRSPTPALVLELPPYRLPRLRNIGLQVYQRTKDFVVSAGTVILACTIVLWALLSFPRDATQAGGEGPTIISESYGGRAARAIEPALKPIGQDWRVGVGIIGSFAAREVLVSTMGLVYGMEADDDDPVELRKAMREDIDPQTGEPRYNALTGLALMVFFVYACQCMSTLAVVRRETGSWGWVLFMFTSMTGVAYLAALLVFQGGRALGYG